MNKFVASGGLSSGCRPAAACSQAAATSQPLPLLLGLGALAAQPPTCWIHLCLGEGSLQLNAATSSSTTVDAPIHLRRAWFAVRLSFGPVVVLFVVHLCVCSSTTATANRLLKVPPTISARASSRVHWPRARTNSATLACLSELWPGRPTSSPARSLADRRESWLPAGEPSRPLEADIGYWPGRDLDEETTKSGRRISDSAGLEDGASIESLD